MGIEIRPSKKEELQQLERMEEVSFNVNGKYFKNGVLPPLPKEDKDAYSFKALWEKVDTETWTILIEEEIAGGAVVKDISTDKKEVALFFISSQIQGKGYGQKALRMIEASYPEVTTWRLVTPTQVIRNAVFYINKCGYSIVSVVDWDKENECGMFVFEKKCGRDRND